MNKKIKITIDSTGEQGNIYHILGMVSNVLKKEHRHTEVNEIRDNVFGSKSYADAIANIREHIDLVDKAGKV